MRSTKPRPSRPARNRQPDDSRRERQLKQGLGDIYREAGGVLGLDVIVEADQAELIASAEQGNQRDRRLLEGVAQILFRRDHAGERAACFCCGKPVDTVVAFVFVAAQRDDAAAQIGGIVCADCDGSREAIARRAMTAWRQSIDPSVRELKVHPSSGRA